MAASLKNAFPYEETEDQLQATAGIKESMERPVPMDRLLAGDVGFGKTEVAMRHFQGRYERKTSGSTCTNYGFSTATFPNFFESLCSIWGKSRCA